MAEQRNPEFDNTQKFIELGYNIAYYRKHMGAIEAPNICRPISLDLLFNIAAVLNVSPARLLTFRE